jgi:flavin reductase (DIM6/NTAB) family NADH-FMN oxidoreductase RutF
MGHVCHGPRLAGLVCHNPQTEAPGVTVITSLGADGRPVGTTANAVSSRSLDPRLVLVCFSASPDMLLVYFRGGYASLAS